MVQIRYFVAFAFCVFSRVCSLSLSGSILESAALFVKLEVLMKRFLSISLVAVLLLALYVSAFADEPDTAANYTVSGVWILKDNLSFYN